MYHAKKAPLRMRNCRCAYRRCAHRTGAGAGDLFTTPKIRPQLLPSLLGALTARMVANYTQGRISDSSWRVAKRRVLTIG